MKTVTARQMHEIESAEFDLHHFSDDVFISAAARQLKERINELPQGKVLFLCGNNRNGDCGLLAASLLLRDSDRKIKAAVSENDSVYHEHAAGQNLEILRVQRLIRQAVSDADIIVDCIYGYDLDEEVSYPYSYWIEWVNAARAYVVSLDVPSGLNSDNGSVMGSCVKADETLAIQLPKIGCYLYPGSSLCGDLKIEDIGISSEAISETETDCNITTYEEMKAALPSRFKHSHKGTYGKVLLIAGSSGKSGACLLSARALMKSGAGLLTVMSERDVTDVVKNNLFEAMTLTVNVGNIESSLNGINFKDYTLIVMGPGLGRSLQTEIVLKKVLGSDLPVVIDADGLYYLKNNLEMVRNRKALTVITPHIVEYQRIFEYRENAVIDDLRRISLEYPNLITVLKSEHTIIAHDGKICINVTGNNALAKGGSGDVLCGVIGGLFAQRNDVSAVEAAVYVHSLAADRWCDVHSSYSLLASDLIEMIDSVLFEMTRGKK